MLTEEALARIRQGDSRYTHGGLTIRMMAETSGGFKALLRDFLNGELPPDIAAHMEQHLPNIIPSWRYFD